MARGTIMTRALSNGEKRYVTVIRLGGKQIWKTFDKKNAAEEYLDRNSTDSRDGTYREIKKATFGKYIEHWKATYLIPEKLKPSTLNGYGSIISKHLTPEFERYQLQAIDAGRIKKFEARLLQSKLAPKTVRNIMVRLADILDAAKEEHYLKISPMPALTPLTKSKKGRAINPSEVQSLLSQCDDNLRLIALVALLSGLRRAELFGLEWKAVDFDKNVISVRQAVFFRFGKHQTIPEGESAHVFVSPKSAASVRDVPLSPALKRELKARYMRSSDKTGLIFQTGKGGPMDPNNVCRWIPEEKKKEGEQAEAVGGPGQPIMRLYTTFNAAVRAAKIGKVRFHDLRHTYGSMLREAKTDYYDIMRWMGHSSIDVTIDIYGQQLVDHGQEAAAKTDAFMFGTRMAGD